MQKITLALKSSNSATVSVDTSSTVDHIYPALIERAKAISTQYDSLQQKLAANYDTSVAKKAGNLASVAHALKQWDQANEVRQLHMLHDGNLLTDDAIQALGELRRLVNDPSTDKELRSLAVDDMESTVAQLNGAAKSLTKSLLPKHPFADLPCLIEIRPGAGGSEAAIFAGDLLRMYQAYCVQNRFRASVIKLDEAEEEPGSITEAILEVESPGAYGVLRTEAGVHRVQRIPATETKGRVHTSSAAVMVLPSFSRVQGDGINFEDPSSDYYIDPKDVRVDVMKARGAGGQHVNKTESAVRLTHVPTNTVVTVRESRSQLANKDKAWQILHSRIAESRREAREEEMLRLRRSVVGVAKIGRGDKIRTYNWQQQRVTDHRSGLTLHGIDAIMSGGPNLERLMDSVRKWLVEREIEAMVSDAQEQDSS